MDSPPSVCLCVTLQAGDRLNMALQQRSPADSATIHSMASLINRSSSKSGILNLHLGGQGGGRTACCTQAGTDQHGSHACGDGGLPTTGAREGGGGGGGREGEGGGGGEGVDLGDGENIVDLVFP